MTDLKRSEVYELQFPIEVDGRVIKEVTLKRPIFKEYRAALLKAKNNEFEAGRCLIQASAELTENEMDNMDLGDFMALAQKFQSFLAPMGLDLNLRKGV